MLEYILPFLIFVSLGVIIYIVGKHLPEIRKFSQNSIRSDEEINDEKSIKKFKGVFYKGGKALRNGFFCLIEVIIKKIKQFLHLVHFWVLKMKKGNNGGDELSREIEVKKELIESEEQNLEKIVEDDLSKHVEIDIKKDIFIDDEVVVDEETITIKEEIEKNPQFKKEDVVVEVFNEEEDDKSAESDNKIESFFSDEVQENEEIDETEAKGRISFSAVTGVFGNFIKKLKKVEVEDSDTEEEFNQNESFSDGIINVTESNIELNNVEESSLIKEVVPVAKKEDFDIDDEIGVDYSILEKKIVQKIANNPKDMENYRALGELYIKMKSFSDAEECYKQILRIHLRDVDAKRKLEKIKLLKRMG